MTAWGSVSGGGLVSSMPPDVEDWIKAAGALVAVLMALLVPIRSWIVEDRRYRDQAKEAQAASARTAVGAVTSSSTMLADTLAISSLAELTDAQWHDAFRAGGVTPDLAERFIRRLKQKIAEGLALEG